MAYKHCIMAQKEIGMIIWSSIKTDLKNWFYLGNNI